MPDVVCACGCGAVLDPGGVSLWFAGRECQQRWQWLQADRPEEVLTGPQEWRMAALAPACSGVRAAFARVAGER